MSLISLRNTLLATGYRLVAKPIFFRRDPEQVHDTVTRLGAWSGKYALTRLALHATFYSAHPRLRQTFAGITWPHPVGLAAGFDKDALLTRVLPNIGFGFMEIGSITGEPCAGNAKPRLWRLPESRSLVVYYGLKNDGAAVVCERIQRNHYPIPLGISIAKTNSQATCEESAGIADYAKAYRLAIATNVATYITVNISCPNAFGGEPFTDATSLDHLLTALTKLGRPLPLFLKLPSDLTPDELRALVTVARQHQVTGLICSNLTKQRSLPTIHNATVPAQGGLSGKIVEPLANKLIAQLYRETKDEFVIVGCGGIFSAEDAYHKIRLGAHLLQMITGMIYQGPQVISQIHTGLEQLLRRDGFASLAEARGRDAHTI